VKEIDLLRSLPKTKRRIDERSVEKDSNVVRIARGDLLDQSILMGRESTDMEGTPMMDDGDPLPEI